MEFNKVLIAGNLGRDPEVKYTGNGAAVANVRMAVIQSKKKLADGSYEEKVAWIDVEMWERTAENFVKYHFKGDNVFIEGRLGMDEWKDKTTGGNRSKIKVICDRWSFTGKKGDDSGGGGQNRERRPQRQSQGHEQEREDRRPQREERAPARHDTRNDEPFDIGDDEVPF